MGMGKDETENATKEDLARARLLLTEGAYDAVERLCRPMLTQHRNSSGEALHLMGLSAMGRGRADAAVEHLSNLTRLSPGHFEAHNDLGLAYLSQDEAEKAVDCFRRTIAIHPEFHVAHYNLGLALKALRDFAAAQSAFESALRFNPRHAQVHFSFGDLLHLRADRSAAIEHYRRAIALEPGYVAAMNHLAIVLSECGELEQAENWLRKALDVDPACAETHCNLGNQYRRNHRFDEAILAYRKAIALKPDFSHAHFNLGLVLLLLGDYTNGWPEYEWRLLRLAKNSGYPRRHGLPIWCGEPISGKTILIYDEQGFGDIFMFARYLPLLRDRGARVVIETRQSLIGMFRCQPAVHQIVARETDAQPSISCDFCLPMASLPSRFATRLETIPRNVPYLYADIDATRHWAERLGQPSPRIALTWAGSSTDPSRSCPLSAFRPLIQRFSSTVRWYAVQKNNSERDTCRELGIVDLSAEIHDFSDTAALLQNVDLAMTIDTSVAHLSAALGRPTWVLLPYLPDWRWLLHRSDSPWYPTARLFRQPSAGNWESVMKFVGDSIAEKVDRVV
jgi:tetratricopeptide (TPR) repeat protein